MNAELILSIGSVLLVIAIFYSRGKLKREFAKELKLLQANPNFEFKITYNEISFRKKDCLISERLPDLPDAKLFISASGIGVTVNQGKLYMYEYDLHSQRAEACSIFKEIIRKYLSDMERY